MELVSDKGCLWNPTFFVHSSMLFLYCFLFVFLFYYVILNVQDISIFYKFYFKEQQKISTESNSEISGVHLGLWNVHWVCSRLIKTISFCYFYLLHPPKKWTNISTCFQVSMDFLLKLRNIKHQNKIQQREVAGSVAALWALVCGSVYRMTIEYSNGSQDCLNRLERSWPRCWNAWRSNKKT